MVDAHGLPSEGRPQTKTPSTSIINALIKDIYPSDGSVVLCDCPKPSSLLSERLKH
ncbi:hypothetical protein EME01_49010 [Sinorhizobium meliloti]|nr:hypothetical protein EME01_49010 [Sinorhizobium meliloti]